MRLTLEIGPTFARLCDASAVAPIGGTQFLAASDDTNRDGLNQIRVYEFPAFIPNDPCEPLGNLDIHEFLCGDEKPDSSELETDIESATRVKDTIFWISSHGRDKKGKSWPDRQRFFAVSLQNSIWRPLGTPYTELLPALETLVPEIKEAEKAKCAPEEGGVSIEGLCEGENGTLLIGFRSPLREEKALVMPILNPREMLEGVAASLGEAFTLDLGGRGIRDWLKMSDDFWLILAGTSSSSGTFALYSWNGNHQTPPVHLGEISEAAEKLGLDDFKPEAILRLENGTLWLISDDGDLKFHHKRNKDLSASKRTFRSAQLILDD